jgi:hypothetical protein
MSEYKKLTRKAIESLNTIKKYHDLTFPTRVNINRFIAIIKYLQSEIKRKDEALYRALHTYDCNFECDTACNIDKNLCSYYTVAKILSDALQEVSQK